MDIDSLKPLETAEQVTEGMLEQVDDCVEGWFQDGHLSQEEFIDRFANDYLNYDGWDILNYDNPATRKIMRRARATKRELA